MGSVIVAAGTAGCDQGASKQDSQFQRLVGSWKVQRLRVDRSAYPERDIRIDFSEEEEGRSYRFVYSSSGDTTIVRGGVDMIGANVVQMTDGFSYPLVWIFDFGEPDDLSSSVRFRLDHARQESAQDFLDVVGLSGGAQRIEMDLVRD